MKSTAPNPWSSPVPIPNARFIRVWWDEGCAAPFLVLLLSHIYFPRKRWSSSTPLFKMVCSISSLLEECVVETTPTKLPATEAGEQRKTRPHTQRPTTRRDTYGREWRSGLTFSLSSTKVLSRGKTKYSKKRTCLLYWKVQEEREALSCRTLSAFWTLAAFMTSPVITKNDGSHTRFLTIQVVVGPP